MVDVAEIIIPKDFDKTYEYLKMFDEYYLQKFKHAEIELLQAKIDFLTTKENESSNPYSANRLERLKKTLNYRLSPSHKSDCKPKFRQKWLFSKYSKQTGLASHKKVIYTDEGNMLNLTEISGRRENFVEHCVGEIQGLSEQICAYKNIKCPIKGCGKENVDAKHVESHKVFESYENKSLACGCLTEKCIKDNPKVVKAFNFATLHAVAALCFYEDFEKE
uniref:Uncharacterized protein n=1 Tax=Panagrolaimus superbus TaxID=310955 RepID=A0A914Z9I9_9BILA